MGMYDIIAKKRDNCELSEAELAQWIEGCVVGSIPDYQSAAMLMAIRLNGLSKQETFALVRQMLAFSDKIDFGDIGGITVDKHSTGGVGDKTTLIAMPIVAAAGLKVVKMSGRGLGHTGGTIDKLEAIARFQSQLSIEQFKLLVRRHGIAIASPSAELVPADQKLYALRDVTATVDSIPLLAASIMSKKVATRADVLVLDVKYDSGAVIHSQKQAKELAQLMIEIAGQYQMRCSALLTSMEQPLGWAVGNALEVAEAVAVLQGHGPADLREISLAVAAEMLSLANLATDEEAALALAAKILDSGAAYAKFVEMIEAQHGDSDFSHLPKAELVLPFAAQRSGFISHIDAEKIGLAARQTGAGRIRQEDAIDPSAGLVFQAKVGAYLQQGETIATIHCATDQQYQATAALLEPAITISDQAAEAGLLIQEIIR